MGGKEKAFVLGSIPRYLLKDLLERQRPESKSVPILDKGVVEGEWMQAENGT